MITQLVTTADERYFTDDKGQRFDLHGIATFDCTAGSLGTVFTITAIPGMEVECAQSVKVFHEAMGAWEPIQMTMVVEA